MTGSKMKNIALFMLLIVTIVFLYGFSFSIQAAPQDGKKLFTEKKCQSCHTVTSEGIESKKKDASDVSNVGAEHNAEFLAKYLLKKEKIDGKEHKAAWKGTDEELKTLTEWLATLKTEKK
jgi:mono/diheme cytochrome c family protein